MSLGAGCANKTKPSKPQVKGSLFHVGGGMSGGMMCIAAASVACNNPAPISKLADLATNGAANPAAARPFASVLN